jgi:hypothetical protein
MPVTTPLNVRNVSRLPEDERSLLLYCDRRPTDIEMRRIQDGAPAAAARPENLELAKAVLEHALRWRTARLDGEWEPAFMEEIRLNQAIDALIKSNNNSSPPGGSPTNVSVFPTKPQT